MEHDRFKNINLLKGKRKMRFCVLKNLKTKDQEAQNFGTDRPFSTSEFILFNSLHPFPPPIFFEQEADVHRYSIILL